MGEGNNYVNPAVEGEGGVSSVGPEHVSNFEGRGASGSGTGSLADEPMPKKKKTSVGFIFGILMVFVALGIGVCVGMTVEGRRGVSDNSSGSNDNGSGDGEVSEDDGDESGEIETDFNAAKPTEEQLRAIIFEQTGWELTYAGDVEVGNSSVSPFEWLYVSVSFNGDMSGHGAMFYRSGPNSRWFYSDRMSGQALTAVCSELSPNERNAFAGASPAGWGGNVLQCYDGEEVIDISPFGD